MGVQSDGVRRGGGFAPTLDAPGAAPTLSAQPPVHLGWALYRIRIT